MSILSKNPREIHPACKEAIVDSLLNGLSARIAGKDEFYKVIYGTKPSAALMSEFIVSMPNDERGGDEEADPIQISAHGVDFQIISSAEKEKIIVSIGGAVYVRILPTETDVQPEGILEVTFPLTREARSEIRNRVKHALSDLEGALPGGKLNPEWKSRVHNLRKEVYESMGLSFDNNLDRSSANLEDEDSEILEEGFTGQELEPSHVQEVKGAPKIPDIHAEAISPPMKWLRLDLALPSFEFTAATAEADARQATATLNSEIAKQLSEWMMNTDGDFGGQLWGYRSGRKIRPSDLNNWNQYLNSLRTSNLDIVVPEFDLRWIFQALPDPIEPNRLSIHVAVENWTRPLTKNNYKELESSFFQLSIQVTLPVKIHKFLRLDRVKPSYRYNEYLLYPALGFNGGVQLSKKNEIYNQLTTTWSPRYILPRIIPSETVVERNIKKLSDPDSLDKLKPFVGAYEQWLEKTSTLETSYGLDEEDVIQQENLEREKFLKDLSAWRAELSAISCGIEILEKSRSYWSGPGKQSSPLGIPFEAWISMNAAMAKVAEAKGYKEWRLFQLAFILASIPTFATRIPEFYDFYTEGVAQYANSVTLLYFATGGGKSEAFLGLLSFVLFLDRLRDKHRGVSALMRYPLRLLTLQQARRTFAVMGAAEEIRYRRMHPGEPFSLGFWVGGANTPNWHKDDGYNDVPKDLDVTTSAELKLKDVQPYKSARERWLKLSSCPFCFNKDDGSLLALRRHSETGNTLGHFCTASKGNCSWNARFEKPTPLPFYIVDEDIYDLAPSVLLGTVDKLSAIGQSQGTIRKFFGMFGFAPFIENNSDRLHIPNSAKEWDSCNDGNFKKLFPSFADGEKKFFDPFPSLLIQDEAHLLDESLGTFSGLFESALEAAFDSLAPLLKEKLSLEPNLKQRRKIKVIAASATVSEPEKQMFNLYQRTNTVQFPVPGPSLYESFYATPLQPDMTSYDIERACIENDDIELRSHWARVYCSILTNGHRHTVAMASVLSHYHLMLTGLYERLRSADVDQEKNARAELVRWVSEGPLQAQFVRLIEQADAATLLTLIDLHRISLTYVTNKKGGDQVIDTEKTQFEKLHRANGYEEQYLNSELISGAVSAAEIQEVVRRAEKRVDINKPFPDLNDTLRSVIATSAISHGVDVEEFNAMFFAGIPSDIAEYIQASSRVGRTHVGFSLLIPVPQRHRDRFVLEIHDIFHRFLERMILPASIDRWAEKALVRVMPSFFQEYICGVNAIERICNGPDTEKRKVLTYAVALDVRDYLDNSSNFIATENFMGKALGLEMAPSKEGKNYYQILLKNELVHYRQDLEVDRLVNATRLVDFFSVRDSSLRPMTSLRDVDQPGIIHESRFDAFFKLVRDGMTAHAMTFIRRGSGADIDSTDSQIESSRDN